MRQKKKWHDLIEMNPILLESQYLLKLPVQPNSGGPEWLRQHSPDIAP
jgi:hypothetical protein